MSLKYVQVTIGAAATPLASTHTPCRQVTIENDAANSHTMRVAGSTVSSSKGIILNNSSTVPGRIQLGSTGGAPSINLDDIYVSGTQNDLVNVIYLP